MQIQGSKNMSKNQYHEFESQGRHSLQNSISRSTLSMEYESECYLSG